jgi:predicted extracellular nuclease
MTNLTWLVTLSVGGVQAALDQVFISEYVEGSSFNKAIELYNGKGHTIDLSEYTLDFHLNGSDVASLSYPLSGLLTANTTYVIANSRASSEIQIVTDFTSDGIWFDGNDVLVLRHNGNVIDSIGQVGINYGDAWGSGLLSSRDQTMRRLSSKAIADINIYDNVDFTRQWHGFDENNFDGLGTYVASGKAFYTVEPLVKATSKTSSKPSLKQNVSKQISKSSAKNLSKHRRKISSKKLELPAAFSPTFDFIAND